MLSTGMRKVGAEARIGTCYFLLNVVRVVSIELKPLPPERACYFLLNVVLVVSIQDLTVLQISQLAIFF